MAALLALKPKLLLAPSHKPAQSRVAEATLFFGIGLYIGFIQAGMGILLLLGMSLFHARELVGANAVKNVLALLVTVAALAVFALFGQIEWIPGLIMAAGNLLGGWAGARLAIKKGSRLIFALLMVVMIATGLKMLWPSSESSAQHEVPAVHTRISLISGISGD